MLCLKVPSNKSNISFLESKENIYKKLKDLPFSILLSYSICQSYQSLINKRELLKRIVWLKPNFHKRPQNSIKRRWNIVETEAQHREETRVRPAKRNIISEISLLPAVVPVESNLCYPVVYPLTQPIPGLGLNVVQTLFESKTENGWFFITSQMFLSLSKKLMSLLFEGTVKHIAKKFENEEILELIWVNLPKTRKGCDAFFVNL